MVQFASRPQNDVTPRLARRYHTPLRIGIGRWRATYHMHTKTRMVFASSGYDLRRPRLRPFPVHTLVPALAVIFGGTSGFWQ